MDAPANLPAARPCAMCRTVDGNGARILIEPTLGAITQRREGTTRDYPTAVYECRNCGARSEVPLVDRRADVNAAPETK